MFYALVCLAHRALAGLEDAEARSFGRAGIAEVLEIVAAASANRVEVHRAGPLVARPFAITTIIAIPIPAVPVGAVTIPVPVPISVAVPTILIAPVRLVPVAIRAAELALAAADDAVAAGACFAGIGEGLAIAAAFATDRRIFARADAALVGKRAWTEAAALVDVNRAGRKRAGGEKDGYASCQPAKER